MNQYVKVTVVDADPMTRLEYNKLRGWELPANENGADFGYLIVVKDAPSNLEGYDGHVSWIPSTVFDGFRRIDNLTFGMAVELMKQGYKVAREGWNGKGMWLTYVAADDYAVDVSAMNLDVGSAAPVPDRQPWIGMKTAQNLFVPWLASQSDMLGEDYYVVNP